MSLSDAALRIRLELFRVQCREILGDEAELLWQDKTPYNGCLLLEAVVVGERRGTEPVRRRADFIAEKLRRVMKWRSFCVFWLRCLNVNGIYIRECSPLDLRFRRLEMVTRVCLHVNS